MLSAAVGKARLVDVEVLHYALDVVAGFSERNAFNPINWVDFGIARISELFNPFLYTTPSGIVVPAKTSSSDRR